MIGMNRVLISIALTTIVAFSFKSNHKFVLGNHRRSTKIQSTQNENIVDNNPLNWFKNMLSQFLTGKSSTNDSELEAIAQLKQATVPSLPTRPAVLLFGGTGKAGKEIVKSLYNKEQIVVTSKSDTQIDQIKQNIFEGESIDTNTLQDVFIKTGVDVTNPASLSSELFSSSKAVVSCIGPSMRDPNLNAENVDYKGKHIHVYIVFVYTLCIYTLSIIIHLYFYSILYTINVYSTTGNLALIEASKQYLNYQKSTLYQSIYDFNIVLRDLKQWTNL